MSRNVSKARLAAGSGGELQPATMAIVGVATYAELLVLLRQRRLRATADVWRSCACWLTFGNIPT